MAVLINPLKAGALGDPTNSVGSDVANAVNALIAAAQASDANIIAMQTGKADTGHSHPLATTTSNGLMSSADKAKLDVLVASGSPDAFLLDRNNHTGFQDMSTITGLVPTLASKAESNHTHPDATTSVSGFLSFTDKAKLNTIASGATVNQTDAFLLNRANHTGLQDITTISGLSTALSGKANAVHTHDTATVTVAGFMSAADKTKLENIAAGATANHTDTYLLNRANHTGTQTIATIVDLQTSLDGKSNTNHGHSVATTSVAGFMSALDKTKLESVAAGATANQTDTYLLNRGNHTGVQAIETISGLAAALAGKQNTLVAGDGITIDTVTNTISSTGGSGGGGTSDHNALLNRTAPDQHPITAITGLVGELNAKAGISHTHTDATDSTSGFMSVLDKAKLNGIAAGATANQADAFLLGRANHTGTQAISTIDNLQTTLDSKQAAATQLTALVTNINAAGSGIFKKTAANTWSFTNIVAADIPSLDTGKLTTGTLPVARGGTGATTLTGLVKGNGTGAFTAAVAGTDYVVPGGSITGNAATATTAGKLTTSRTITFTGEATGSFSFDGSIDVNTALTLANSGVTAGTYRSVTVDSKGRVTTGTNPTTIAGYGITDAVSVTGSNATGTWGINIAGSAKKLTNLVNSLNTGSSSAGDYCKFLRVTIPAQYQEYDCVSAVLITDNSSVGSTSELLTVRVKQQAAFGTDPEVYLNSRTLTSQAGIFEYGYVVVQNSSPTTVDFYFRSTNTYTQANFSVLNERMSVSAQSVGAQWLQETALVTLPAGYVVGSRTHLVHTTAVDNKVAWSGVSTPTSINNLQTILENGTLGYLRKTAASTYTIDTKVPATSVSGTLPVANGGTGATTLTGLIKGNGASAFTAAVAGTDYVIPSGSITGNAGTATVLKNDRTINGVSFNGSQNISLPVEATTRTTISGNTTLTRLGKRVRTMVDTSAGNVVVTINPGLYSAGDVEELIKIMPTNVLTITASTGVISLPDSTSAASHTLTGVRGNLILDYVSATELRLSAIF